MRRLRAASLVFAALTAVACASQPATTPISIALLTQSQPAQACEDALATGRLARDPQSGLALQSSTGEISRVMWPFGYSARLVDERLELLDAQGSVIAGEGDSIEMGGGFGPQGLFYACAGSVRRA